MAKCRLALDRKESEIDHIKKVKKKGEFEEQLLASSKEFSPALELTRSQ